MAPHSDHSPFPPSVNFHLWRPCNMRCRFCFATFDDTRGRLPKGHLVEDDAVAVVERLAAAGFRKITFAGGEPTQCPWLERLVRVARGRGLTTMLVTNGSLLDGLSWVFERQGPLDWVTLSIDSGQPHTHVSLGRHLRGVALGNQHYLELARRLREAGVRLKLNTVITALNVGEDMRELVAALKPERWKILRVLPVAGQNDDGIDGLHVEADDFGSFVERHRSLGDTHGIQLVPEDHEDIRGSYAMVDPGGRFFDNTQGGHTYSRPILEVGAQEAWKEVSFRPHAFVARDGHYDWGAPVVSVRRLVRGTVKSEAPGLIALTGLSGAGKDTVAELLARHDYRRVALADGLKRHVKEIFDLTDLQLWGSERNEVLPHLGCTPRELYQRFSDACLALDGEVWRRPWTREIQRRLQAGQRIVCSDVRTPEELAVVRALGGRVWRIARPGAGAPGAAGAHATERALAELPNRAFDVVIDNDDGLDQLARKVEVALALPR